MIVLYDRPVVLLCVWVWWGAGAALCGSCVLRGGRLPQGQACTRDHATGTTTHTIIINTHTESGDAHKDHTRAALQTRLLPPSAILRSDRLVSLFCMMCVWCLCRCSRTVWRAWSCCRRPCGTSSRTSTSPSSHKRWGWGARTQGRALVVPLSYPTFCVGGPSCVSLPYTHTWASFTPAHLQIRSTCLQPSLGRRSLPNPLAH